MGIDIRSTGTETSPNSSAARWWALAAMTLAVVAVGLDVTVLAIALPTLATSLHASSTDLQWITAGYALALPAGMLPAGLLGDRYGRKKVTVISLVLFGAGSIACACAPSPGALIAARIVLGAAGAGVAVMALSVVTVLFSEKELTRATGIWAGANFLALPIGPILGGWLLTHYWWGWVFLINVPISLVGLVAVLALVPESRAAERPRLDLVGVLTSSAAMAAWTYGLVDEGRNGWIDARTLLPLAAGVVLLAAFVLWERRLSRISGEQPLVDLTLFSSASFAWGLILAAVIFLPMFGLMFVLPQYFQAVLGTDAQGSGLRLLPLIIGFAAGAVPADFIAARVGAKVTVALGFAVVAAAMLLGATTGTDSSDAFVAAWLVVTGAGTALGLVTAASAALSEIPKERSGVGSALMQAFQKLGAPFGAAIVGSVLSSGYQSQLDLSGLPAAVAGVARESVFAGVAVAQRLHSASLLGTVREAFVHGMDAALLVTAGIAVAGALLALAFLPGRAARAAETAPESQPSV